MVIVKKPDKIKICIDPRPLNKALKRSHYIMPRLGDILYKLPEARIFLLVVAREAFLQCKLKQGEQLTHHVLDSVGPQTLARTSFCHFSLAGRLSEKTT